MKAKISEIFKSIQGEGPYQGITQVFIRFFGCNLKCNFCDTKLKDYREMDVSELVRKISAFRNYHSIALTGGEPLIQIEFLKSLAKLLKADKKTIYLETNGTLPQNLNKIVDYIDIVAMDFKLPSSTTLKDFWAKHREFLRIAHNKDVFIKAVIGNGTRIEDVRIGTAIIKEVRKDIPFILQPQNPFEDELKEKLRYFEKVCKQRSIKVKVIPQLHKKLGLK